MTKVDEMHQELASFSRGAGRRRPQFVGSDGEFARSAAGPAAIDDLPVAETTA